MMSYQRKNDSRTKTALNVVVCLLAQAVFTPNKVSWSVQTACSCSYLVLFACEVMYTRLLLLSCTESSQPIRAFQGRGTGRRDAGASWKLSAPPERITEL
uniref:Uncharacterized protein n=1 Tax=Nothobranchius korthausae TaxID=1143690 RepID=A0A1A8GGZ8_9TELE